MDGARAAFDELLTSGTLISSRFDHSMVIVQFPLLALRNSTLFVSLFVNTIVLNGPTASRALTVCDPPSGFVEEGRVTLTI
jgi:hypothetical protein